MAKAAKTTNDNDEKPAKAEFDIQYLERETGRQRHMVRQGLRKLGIETTDGRYRWNKKSDADAVVKQLMKQQPKEDKEKKTTKKAA